MSFYIQFEMIDLLLDHFMYLLFDISNAMQIDVAPSCDYVHGLRCDYDFRFYFSKWIRIADHKPDIR